MKSYFEEACFSLQHVLMSFIKVAPFFGALCLPILKWMYYAVFQQVKEDELLLTFESM